MNKITEPCVCKFVGVATPLDARQCTVHTKSRYKCDRCACLDYRPASIKKSPTHWPTCVCGHMAQDHN